MTDATEMPDDTFNRFTSLSEKASREAAVHADEAFIAAMNREIKRGKVKARAGVFVDSSPPIGAIRIRGDVILSSCGSPAAMCVDQGGPTGARSLR